ncbi:GNAT family N-acetyltransferase [Planktotalea sp.]|uniref:GNAT family N-acetyltransferase n=1 Tax=Planktotalea sp. TaxID=2029877 RepID=UPI003299B76F
MLTQTDTLTLRRLAKQDIDAFLAYRCDPDVAKFQGWEHMDRNGALGFLEHMAQVPLLQLGQWTQLALAGRSDDVLLGDFGVHLSGDGREIELGITLAADAQGRNIGFEAVEMITAWLFARTQIDRIVAITHADNKRALSLLSRTPFKHTHDTHDVIDGVATPERWFELRRDWFQARRVSV